MSPLTIHLLGGFRVEREGQRAYGFETDKARALLAFLAVEADHPHRRERLARLLWPDRSEREGRANLRQTLSRVRRALDDREGRFLYITPDDVQFNTGSDYRLDVCELERLAADPAQLTEPLPQSFCGDFLAGFAVPDSEEFQAWVLARREHYRRLATSILSEQAGGATETRAAARNAGAPAPPFAGRTAELVRLDERLDAALGGAGRVTLVCGDAGSGKTALIESFAAAALARHPDLIVAGARCSARGGGAEPYALLRGLAEMLFGDLEAGPTAMLSIPGCDGRLREASEAALTALSEHGLPLIETLAPAGGIQRRFGALPEPAESARSAPGRSEWRSTLSAKLERIATRGPSPTVASGLLDALANTLAALARRRPVLLLLDDLHWVDEAGASFLLRLGRDVGRSRVLAVGAYRSAFATAGRDSGASEARRHPLEGVLAELCRDGGDMTIDLDRADGREFVEAFVDSGPNRLGAGFRNALHAHTGGHALFTVESFHTLQERGQLDRDEIGRWVAAAPVKWEGLPSRVEAAIAERIEQLPSISRAILAAASVEGDEFTAELVAGLAGLPVSEAIATLSGPLARRYDLVRPLAVQHVRGQVRSIYRFTHHLFQVYLHGQLDAVERSGLHAAVAAALVQAAAEDTDELRSLSGRLAWHYEQAGQPWLAAQALHEAGREAVRLSAYQSAIEIFEHAKTLLAGVPPSPERIALAHRLEVALLAPHRALEGWSATGFRDSLARAQEGIDQSGDTLAALFTRFAETGRLIAAGELEEALAQAELLRAAAQKAGDDRFVLLSHLHAGVSLAASGQTIASETHLAHFLPLEARERCRELRDTLGEDPGAVALIFSAVNQWKLGRIDVAVQRSRDALAEVQTREDAASSVWPLVLGTNLLFLVRELEEGAAWLTRAERLVRKGAYNMWQSFLDVMASRLSIERGGGVEEVERMLAAMSGWQARGARVGGVSLAVLCCEACLELLRRVQQDELAQRERILSLGRAVAEGSLRITTGPGTRMIESEPHRMRALMVLAGQGSAAEAEAGFRTAIRIARGQAAPMLELRAQRDLVAWLSSVRPPGDAELAEARAELIALYASFPARWNYPDLTETAQLLANAGHGPG